MTLALFATFIACSGFAQTIQRRGRIENVTDYSVFTKTPTGGARRVGLRSSAPLPCFGSPKIPVVLVQFADQKFLDYDKDGVVRKRYDDYFNLKQGNAGNSLGSVYQYFKEQSYGQFTPEFDIIGPITLSKEYAYYGEDWYNGKKLVKRDVNINEFYREVCHNVVTNENKDWSSFDNNHDGAVDMIFFIYAGEGENAFHVDDEDESKIQYDKRDLIWPKESGNTEVFADITFGSYGMTNELYLGYVDGIGTAVHELSHGLGLPDLYDTKNYSATKVDVWDIMDGGNYQIAGYAPIGYSAYERDFMGWRQIVTLETNKAYTLTINPIESDGVAYKVVNPNNQNEYLILENRQNMGYDKYMPWTNDSLYLCHSGLHGLLITHVDYDMSSWTSNKVNGDKEHYRYQIVPADGKYLNLFFEMGDEKEKIESLLGDLYPGKNNVREISSYKMFNGGDLNQTIDNIREVDGIIYVDINGGTIIPELQNTLASEIATAKTYVDKKMGKAESDALANAIASAESVARDQDAIEKCIGDLRTAVADAIKSNTMYANVAIVIGYAQNLGDAGKASFADIITAYDNGTITSLADVNKAYDAAVVAQNVANLKVALATEITTAKTYVEKKMGKDALSALNDAISAAENVGDNVDDINNASANIAEAVEVAKKSIRLYSDVLKVIEKAALLGEVGKATFAASGVQEQYDNGTITSLGSVNAAYEKALSKQNYADEIAKELNDLTDSINVAKSYMTAKMGQEEMKRLAEVIADAEDVARSDMSRLVNVMRVKNSFTYLSTYISYAIASIELYEKVAEYIAKVDALGEAAKESFIGVRKAYDDGTITSLEDVEAAYAEAVRAQEEANGIGDVKVDAKSLQIYTTEGKTISTLGHGINIVKDANGKAVKVIKK